MSKGSTANLIGMGCLALSIVGAVGVGGCIVCTALQAPNAADESDAGDVVGEPEEPVAELPATPLAPPPPPTPAWVRSTWMDELSQEEVVQRRAQSESAFELRFPYAGPQYAALTLREHPRFGQDVILSIERGQIPCLIRGCQVQVAFDDGEVESWRAVGPEDGGSTQVFLRNVGGFTRKLERAAQVRIAVTLFREGQRTFVFPGLAEPEPEPDAGP